MKTALKILCLGTILMTPAQAGFSSSPVAHKTTRCRSPHLHRINRRECLEQQASPISTDLLFDSTTSLSSISSSSMLSTNLLVSHHDSYSASIPSLTFWIVSFSVLHIGMSAIRSSLIDILGRFAEENLNLVDRSWTLPDFWPGDDVGQRTIFPDSETAGRQLYRMLYTIISFVTLISAFTDYISIRSMHGSDVAVLNLHPVGMAVASFAGAISLASLLNPSPFSLVPGFQSSSSSNNVLVERQDSLKLVPKGLTRITRHPLILPVVPWGVATTFLLGSHMEDAILFIGLAIYAVLGCAAQDLRVRNQEGSVGTVFGIDSKEASASSTQSALDDFFESTSYVPFAAILDGRQSFELAWKEFPWLGLVIGCVLAYFIQETFLLTLNELVMSSAQ